MKYAIAMPLDQTYGYIPKDWPENDHTIKHPEALLLDTKEEAQKILDELPKSWGADIVEVIDENEFRSRADTW